MLDPQSMAEFSSEITKATNNELEQRLGLYRVFLKLYEHHRGLLDEILELENVNGLLQPRLVQYIQAVVQDRQVYLVTNLVQSTPIALFQPQNLWIIGRDHQATVPIQDKRLSRRHAAIQYIEQQGFYLIDLQSTNGSFVNGEPLRHVGRLRDGDQIRLGSLVFHFFSCEMRRMQESLHPDWIEQIQSAHQSATVQSIAWTAPSEIQPRSEYGASLSPSLKETSLFRLDH
jgi:hypothetical protein